MGNQPYMRRKFPRLIIGPSLEAIEKLQRHLGGPAPQEYRVYAQKHDLSLKVGDPSPERARRQLHNDVRFYNSEQEVVLYYIPTAAEKQMDPRYAYPWAECSMHTAPQVWMIADNNIAVDQRSFDRKPIDLNTLT